MNWGLIGGRKDVIGELVGAQSDFESQRSATQSVTRLSLYNVVHAHFFVLGSKSPTSLKAPPRPSGSVGGTCEVESCDNCTMRSLWKHRAVAHHRQGENHVFRARHHAALEVGRPVGAESVEARCWLSCTKAEWANRFGASGREERARGVFPGGRVAEEQTSALGYSC